MRLFLDANAVLKRYIAEPGSDAVTRVFMAADAGRATLQYSLWTLGECLGVFDRLERQGRFPRGGMVRGQRALFGETARLARLGVLSVAPLRAGLVRRAWDLLLRYHLYQADALQIASAVDTRSDLVLTSHAHVARGAAGEGLRVLDPETDALQIDQALRE